MRLETVRRRKTLINVTSLIDVVFLLLIFFVVTSTFLEQPGLDLTLPEAGSAEPAERQDVTLGVTSDGTIYLGDSAVDRAGLREAIEAALEQASSDRVVLQADARVSHGLVVEVMDAARLAGARGLVVATEPPEVPPAGP